MRKERHQPLNTRMLSRISSLNRKRKNKKHRTYKSSSHGCVWRHLTASLQFTVSNHSPGNGANTSNADPDPYPWDTVPEILSHDEWRQFLSSNVDCTTLNFWCRECKIPTSFQVISFRCFCNATYDIYCWWVHMMARGIGKVTPPEIEDRITPDDILKGNTFSKPSFLGYPSWISRV